MIGCTRGTALAGLLAALLPAAPAFAAPEEAKAAPFTHEGGVLSLAYRPDGRLLASGGLDGTVRLWHPETGVEVGRCVSQCGRVPALAFSGDGKWLASGGSDGVIVLWDGASGRKVRELKGHEGTVSGLFFSGDGKTLASSSFDETARLWDVATGKEVRRFEGHDQPVAGVVLMPDGRRAVTAGYDSSLRVWDTATGKQTRRIQRARRGEVTGVALVGGGRWLTSSAINGTLGRAPLEAEDELHAETNPGVTGALLSLGCSADGKVLAVGNNNGEVFLVEVATWQLLHRFSGDERTPPRALPWRRGEIGPIRAVAVSPCGRDLAVGLPDGRVGVWPLLNLLAPQRLQAAPLTGDELAALWDRLGAVRADGGWQALVTLASDPERSVPALARRLAPAPRPDPGRVAKLIADLGDEDFGVRERASAELDRLLPGVEGELRLALRKTEDLEMRTRLRRLLAGLEEGAEAGDRLRALRAVVVLEQAGTPEARSVLERLANGQPGALLSEEAAAALKRLGR